MSLIRIEEIAFYLAFFVLMPAIAVTIGYAAWRGEPKSWDRSMYWTAFIGSMVASMILMGFGARGLDALRVSTWAILYLLVFGLGLLFFGVAGGCFVGIFIYGRGAGPIWREVRQADNSTGAREEDSP